MARGVLWRALEIPLATQGDRAVLRCRCSGAPFAAAAPMNFHRSLLASLALTVCGSLSGALVGCSAPSGDTSIEEGADAISSRDAVILDFRFSGELVAPANVEARKAVVSQMMYMQGALTTTVRGNGKVGQVDLENVTEVAEGATKRISYTASLPVAWPKRIPQPTSYAVVLPSDATAFDAFNRKYDGRCGDNEYGQSTFWHDWNPLAEGCVVDDVDVIRASATVGPHALETHGKYPEYDQMWADDRLDVVAIFGIISSNTPGDWGWRELADFQANAEGKVGGAAVENPTSRSILADRTVTGKVMVGGVLRDVKVDILLVNELASAGPDFDARYGTLSEKADLVLYNGHAGLGKNVNALARKGQVTAGKYQLLLLNGCQTFAYIDSALNDRRIEANGAANDPRGTRFLDVIGNALPGYASNLASMSNTVFDAAVTPDRPKTYDDLMATMPASHIVVVFGEDDNRFQP